jgi:hypothetical protein
MLHVDNVPERCEDECCTPPPLILSPKPTVDRLPLVREAFRLEWITIGWMIIENVVAIGSGILSGSLVLLAFGLDSVIELISAGVLMWPLSVELRHGHVFFLRMLSGSQAGSEVRCYSRWQPMWSWRQAGIFGRSTAGISRRQGSSSRSWQSRSCAISRRGRLIWLIGWGAVR